MKKILLSLLFAGSFAAANAQTASLLITDSSASEKVHPHQYAANGPISIGYSNTSTGNFTGANGYYLKLTGTAAGYYVGSADFYGGVSLGFTGTSVANSYLTFSVATNGTTTTTVEFSFKTLKGREYHTTYTPPASAQTAFVKDSILISNFTDVTTGTLAPTVDSMQAFTQVYFKLKSSNATGVVEADLDNIYLKQYVAAAPAFIIFNGDASSQKISNANLTSFGATGSTVSFPTTGSGATSGNHNIYVKAVSTGANPSNYQGGFGGATYTGPGAFPSFNYTGGTTHSTTYVKYRITTANVDSVKVELQFNTASTGAATYQYGFDKTYNHMDTPAALAGWVYDSIALTDFRLIVSNSLTSTPLLSDSIPYLGKFGVSINSLKNGVRTTEVNMDDVTFVEGGVSSIFAAAPTSTNVTSSSLYPNPATGVANVKLSLKSTSLVKLSVSDVMGKVMYTSPEVSTNDYNNTINLSGYNKGLYTVSFIVDGGVAKSQLLVVE